MRYLDIIITLLEGPFISFQQIPSRAHDICFGMIYVVVQYLWQYGICGGTIYLAIHILIIAISVVIHISGSMSALVHMGGGVISVVVHICDGTYL